jgi:DNA replication licensing factor MCM4
LVHCFKENSTITEDEEDEIHTNEAPPLSLELEDIDLEEKKEFTFFTNEGKVKLSQQKIMELKKLSQEVNIIPKLINSVAPSIFEHDLIKKGLLAQLFGGTTKRLKDGKFRGEINVLLVGDPGTSKSQLLKYVNKLAPRGIYTSGKGSSAVGLTG